VPVTRAFGDEAETQRAPRAIGRDVVEDLPLDAAAATVSISAAHGSADGAVVNQEVHRRSEGRAEDDQPDGATRRQFPGGIIEPGHTPPQRVSPSSGAPW